MKPRLSTGEVCDLFKVSRVTLFHWRNGTFHKTKLPFHTEPHGTIHRIHYKWGEVKKWAKENDVSYELSEKQN